LSLTIRDAGTEDAPAVTELVGQLGYPSSTADVARRLERLTSSLNDRVVVAELDGEMVGLAALQVSLSVAYDDPVAKLAAIVVDDRHRGHGVGKALVAAIEKEARARGCSSIFLTTAEGRAGAHAFYRAIGFEETGRRFVKSLG
jgi:N-acetylglutamate synthase-like GNAT family acetyltransferase